MNYTNNTDCGMGYKSHEVNLSAKLTLPFQCDEGGHYVGEYIDSADVHIHKIAFFCYHGGLGKTGKYMIYFTTNDKKFWLRYYIHKDSYRFDGVLGFTVNGKSLRSWIKDNLSNN